MKEREAIIKNYFNMWVTQNFKRIEELFSEDIYYSECYGPEYHGILEIQQWISESVKRQKVLAWHSKQFIHQGNITVVEWYFKDRIGEVEHAFDGVSIIIFTNQNKILSIKEFESKTKHTRPFAKIVNTKQS